MACISFTKPVSIVLPVIYPEVNRQILHCSTSEESLFHELLVVLTPETGISCKVLEFGAAND
jgi:hypothetical protein